jgi:serine protease AprX
VQPRLKLARESSASCRRLKRRSAISALVLSSMVFAVLAPSALADVGASGKAADTRATGELLDVSRQIMADRVGATGEGVQIALIDTGVVDVPGLRYSNVIIGPDFSFEDQDPELRARDTNGHGTHLAGIMVAADEAWVAGDHRRGEQQHRSGRVLGIAPSAQLVSIKVGAADGSADVTQVIAAINWVIEHKNDAGFDIRVINLAFGTDGTQDYRVDPLAYAVERAWAAGLVVVVAAGNNGAGGGITNPALDPYVIAVGGSEAGKGWREAVAEFSSGGDGSRGVDIIAPGRSIISLRNPGSFSDLTNEQGRVGDWMVRGTGTSQASAVVSASVALLLELHPSLTPDQVKAALMKGADRIIGSDSATPGYLNVLRASLVRPDDTPQVWERSTGTGSIAAARGSYVLVLDGVPLAGEVDIFGNSWTGNSWTVDSWTGNSWTGNSWTGNSWTGNSWTGNSWTGNSWTGNSWTGNSWTGNSWTGNSWTGNSWTGNSWTGNSWTGNSWAGSGWQLP